MPGYLRHAGTDVQPALRQTASVAGQARAAFLDACHVSHPGAFGCRSRAKLRVQDTAQHWPVGQGCKVWGVRSCKVWGVQGFKVLRVQGVKVWGVQGVQVESSTFQHLQPRPSMTESLQLRRVGRRQSAGPQRRRVSSPWLEARGKAKRKTTDTPRAAVCKQKRRRLMTTLGRAADMDMGIPKGPWLFQTASPDDALPWKRTTTAHRTPRPIPHIHRDPPSLFPEPFLSRLRWPVRPAQQSQPYVGATRPPLSRNLSDHGCASALVSDGPCVVLGPFCLDAISTYPAPAQQNNDTP